MPVLNRLIRYTRKAARSAGLIERSCAALAREIADLVDHRAPELLALHPAPGLSTRIILADGSVIERNFGVADAASRSPMTADTVFQVMSISKPVTAFGVMRLAELGILDPDAPVSEYLRTWDLPLERRHGYDFQHVTLRRILCHTAGLNVHGFLWAEPDAPAPTTAQLLDGIEGPDFVLRMVDHPGAAHHYSGGGYTLAQHVIQDVTGRPFADVMHDELLTPLGMTSSSFVETPAIRANLATRHAAGSAPLPRRLCAAHAPTGLYTTARDITALWAAMLVGPNGEPPGRGLIRPKIAHQLITPTSTPAPGRSCGLGFFLWPKRTDTIFAHSGFKQGWWSEVNGLQRRRCVFAVCCNGDDGQPVVKAICSELRQLLLDRAL